MNNNMNIPSYIKYCMDTVAGYGYQIYLVGGCVRDMLMGVLPFDYDLCTDAAPSCIMDMFEIAIPTGFKHGTVTVVVEKQNVEITAMRTDGEYLDSRRPSFVEYTSDIASDLSRRDFTVNAIAMDGNGNIIDPFGGADDIKNKILKCVGEPSERFSEDALRIMRLFRFMCRLPFEAEEKTLETAFVLSELLVNISIERIYIELIKALTGEYAYKLYEFIKNGALYFVGIEAVSEDFLKIGEIEQTKEARFAFLLYCANADYMAVCNALKTDNLTKRKVKFILNNLKYADEISSVELKRLLRMHEISDIIMLVSVLKTVYSREYTQTLVEFERIAANNEPFSLHSLAVDGNDILKIGIKKEKISGILEHLLEIVINDPSKNNYDTLINIIGENFYEKV